MNTEWLRLTVLTIRVVSGTVPYTTGHRVVCSTVHHADYFVHFHTISVYHGDYFDWYIWGYFFFSHAPVALTTRRLVAKATGTRAMRNKLTKQRLFPTKFGAFVTSAYQRALNVADTLAPCAIDETHLKLKSSEISFGQNTSSVSTTNIG